MSPNEIYQRLEVEFGDDIISLNEEPGFEPAIKVNPNNIVDIMLFLRDSEGLEFDYPSCLSGVDLVRILCCLLIFFNKVKNIKSLLR
jgi:hypothetical protein